MNAADHPVTAIRRQAELDRLRRIAEWAIDAAHHPGCSGGNPRYPCKCGRRDLFPEEAPDA